MQFLTNSSPVIAICQIQKLRQVVLWLLICVSHMTQAQTALTTQCQALVKHSQANKIQIETFQLVIQPMGDGSVAMHLQGNTSLAFSYVQPKTTPASKPASDMKITLQKNAWDFHQTHTNSSLSHLQINPISGALQYTQANKVGAERLHIDGACELPLMGKETFIQAHAPNSHR